LHAQSAQVAADVNDCALPHPPRLGPPPQTQGIGDMPRRPRFSVVRRHGHRLAGAVRGHGPDGTSLHRRHRQEQPSRPVWSPRPTLSPACGALSRSLMLRIATRGPTIHTLGMHKTTLVLDDAKLRRAQKALGTRGIKDTIDRALDEVLALEARRRLVDRLRASRGVDLADEKIMRRAWR
jgi:hypothetical protein